ncbi:MULTISPECIES: class E sortase [unclassified Nocardioides]|uniref:class E sortase n=1 Tax=unclassified Nocardioides TaxID=2615069 RepID=UPI00005706A4|nr:MULTISPECIES: class E sortase [unclassified Nocardioides]ABL80442.1 peptidase C60, sortase A and B [Nocardioides sp. JS614]
MTMTLEKPVRPRRALLKVPGAASRPGGSRKQPERPARTARRPARPVGPPTGADAASSVLSSAFTMIAIVCLWVAAQLLFLGSISQNRAQDLLYDELRADLAAATAPLGPVVPVGDPVALLTIPSIGVEQVVVEGTASGDLLDGPGHRRDTVLPGQVGTSVVYGRAATYGAPFADLPDLRAGDEVEVTGAQGRTTYTVLGVRRAGDPLPQPVADGSARLTLVTAEGSGRLGAITPESVVYVDADATKAFPAPPGRPGAVPDSEKAMAADDGALPLLALCLALLLALTLGVVAARQRWSTALVWVVASPLAIALSWAATDVVMRLLPNLI